MRSHHNLPGPIIWFYRRQKCVDTQLIDPQLSTTVQEAGL